MLDRRTLEKLGSWEGYRLKDVIWPEGETGTVELHLEPTRKVMSCSSCGQRCR
jgi:transposase